MENDYVSEALSVETWLSAKTCTQKADKKYERWLAGDWDKHSWFDCQGPGVAVGDLPVIVYTFALTYLNAAL